MKCYPSIPLWNDCRRRFGELCCVFRKYDGSNLRFSWSPKRGWYKFGTRTRLFDKTDPVFGPAIDLFAWSFGEGIEKRLIDSGIYKRPESIVAFCEFFGPHSFAGQHDPAFLKVEANDPKRLVLLDVGVYKQGFVPPGQFRKIFAGTMPVAEEITRLPFTEQFCRDVWEGHLTDGEGVIVKGGQGHDIWMAKVKTKAYMERLEAVFGINWKKYW